MDLLGHSKSFMRTLAVSICSKGIVYGPVTTRVFSDLILGPKNRYNSIFFYYQ